MNYGEIKNMILQWEGPVSLFVSGCTHHCPGCFNQETWDFGFGKPYTEETEREILEALAPGYIAGLSLLGGEPFEPVNQEVLVGLLRKFKERFPKKTVWCYTGYLFGQGTFGRKPGQVPVDGRNAFHESMYWWTEGLWRQKKTLRYCSADLRISG